MIKHLITATLFALGGAGVALVGYLAVDPLAFTHPVVELPSVAANRAPTAVALVGPEAETNPEAETHSVVLAEVRIIGAPRKASNHAVRQARFDPCSEWRDIGVLVVDSAGTASGVRSVRALCASPGDDR
jgi:hypothetical protein